MRPLPKRVALSALGASAGLGVFAAVPCEVGRIIGFYPGVVWCLPDDFILESDPLDDHHGRPPLFMIDNAYLLTARCAAVAEWQWPVAVRLLIEGSTK